MLKKKSPNKCLKLKGGANTSFASHLYIFLTLIFFFHFLSFTLELVKAGLVLALFGGSQKYADDKNRIPIRGDPHVLIVGDPGLGKSQMLQVGNLLLKSKPL